MIQIKYILELTDTSDIIIISYLRRDLNCFPLKKLKNLHTHTLTTTWSFSSNKNTDMKWKTNLGSAQKDALSNSGTISVTFKYLAIATISHICTITSHQIIKTKTPNTTANIKHQTHVPTTYRRSHLIQSSIARHHQVTIVFINPCKKSTKLSPSKTIGKVLQYIQSTIHQNM